MEVSRREILGGLVASGVSVALASQSVVGQAAAQDLATGVGFLGEHRPRPLAFDPKKLPGLSEKLLTSHRENNYGGGVKALNAIEKKLASAVKDKDITANMYGALKREHLVRTGTVALHEYYFGNLGGVHPIKWITRERPKTDRIACPWLIQRFVDKDAEFLYLLKDKVLTVAAEKEAVPYDVPCSARF